MKLIDKYLTEADAFKIGKFQVKVGQRIEKGKKFNEYGIYAAGGALKFFGSEIQDLEKVLDKIRKLDWTQPF